MFYRLKPPTKGFATFELDHLPDSDEIEVRLLNDSYVLSHSELSEWLAALGCPNASRVVDFVWNRRRVSYDLLHHNIVVPDDQPEDVRAMEIEGLASATFGSRVPFEELQWQSPFDDQPPLHRINHRR